MECPDLQGARRLLFPGLPFNPLPHLRSRLIRKRDRRNIRRLHLPVFHKILKPGDKRLRLPRPRSCLHGNMR